MQEKTFINNLLHFNLEFVAGEYNTYDKLLNEAFEPALDVFLECPKWHADIELSGMQLEYMEHHFPWMIEKLQKIHQRGQIDIICVHYSETIWPAFPYYDFVKSWSIDKEILDRLKLTPAKTFFAQENFFGEGLAKIKDQIGIAHAIIPEKNYSWPFEALNPLYPRYDMNGLNLIIRGDSKHENKWWIYTDAIKDVKIKWTYDKCGDGEPWLGGDPYENFWRDETKIAHKKAMYDTSIEQGILFTTTNEFIQSIDALGIEKPKLKAVPDGPWGLEKPGVFQWMGFYFSFYELDVEMRSLSFRSRTILLAAETLISMAKSKNIDTNRYENLLSRAWKKQINSEVSDSSGWVPTLIEMYYAIDNAINTFYLGEKICLELRKQLGIEGALIDTNKKIILQKSESLAIKLENEKDIPIKNIEFFGTNQTVNWIQQTPNKYLLEFDFLHIDINSGVKFPLAENQVQYSPALMDEELISHPFSYYNSNCTHLYLGLPNGLFGLGNNWWVIKHNDSTNVAAKVNFVEKKVEFMTLMNIMAQGAREQLSIEIKQRWRFTIMKGTTEEALKEAKKINLFPIVPADYKLWNTDKKEPYPWIPFTRMVSK